MKNSRYRSTLAFTFGIPILLGLAVFAICCFIQVDSKNELVEFYGEKMRASLFAGFLTLGGFLLSLKTGIVIKIKENVYDSEKYLAKVEEAQANGVETTVYGPLRRLSLVLSTAVYAALITSALQLTLGLFPKWWAASLCLSVAAFALALLLVAFKLIQVNLTKWFEFLDEKASEAQELRRALKREQPKN
jgi:hypothetical protein